MSEEWKPVFEPAKEGDKPAEGVWVPNRAYRRAAKKGAKKLNQNGGALMPDMSSAAKGLLHDPEFRADLFESLYKDFMERKEKKEKELYGSDDEENRDQESNE